MRAGRTRSRNELDRRRAIRVVASLLLVGFLSGTAPGDATVRRRPPNIVFVLSDNQRWDFMGCAGHLFVRTPHLDRLAEEGILFSNAFVTTSLCSPSRASFLTVQTARTHGVRDNLTPWNEESLTFLELLEEAGYESAFIGKWHMPGRLPPRRKRCGDALDKTLHHRRTHRLRDRVHLEATRCEQRSTSTSSSRGGGAVNSMTRKKIHARGST